MLIEVVYLLKCFNLSILSSFNGLEVLAEFSFCFHLLVVDLLFEDVQQLLHDDVQKFLFASCSCLCIVACVMLSVSYVVIQGIISDSLSSFPKVRHSSEVALG